MIVCFPQWHNGHGVLTRCLSPCLLTLLTHAGMPTTFPNDAFPLLIEMLVLDTISPYTWEHANDVGFATVQQLFDILPEMYTLVKDIERVKHVLKLHKDQHTPLTVQFDGWNISHHHPLPIAAVGRRPDAQHHIEVDNNTHYFCASHIIALVVD